MFRNVGIENSDAGELPRRKYTIFRTRRKFEIKNTRNIVKSVRILILHRDTSAASSPRVYNWIAYIQGEMFAAMILCVNIFLKMFWR